MNKDLLTYLNC